MDFKASLNSAIDIVTGKLSGWLEKSIAILPNVLIAIVLVVAFVFLARLARYTFQKIYKRSPRVNANLLTIGSNIVYLFILILGLFIALSVMNLDKTVTSILAGAGVIGLALGFAFQDTASNFISGLFIAFRRPFNKGDFIETQNYLGTVKAINLRSTVMETVHGLEVIIPNKEVYQNAITNYTSTKRRRVDIAVGVSYADDLDLAEKLAVEAVQDLQSIDNSREDPISFIYNEFGDSSINFSIRIWLVEPAQGTYLAARSEAIKKIKKSFDKNGISIPFPIRTLDFGIEGGEKLNEVLDLQKMNGNQKKYASKS